MRGLPPQTLGVHLVTDFELNDHRVNKHLHNVAVIPHVGRFAIHFDVQGSTCTKGGIFPQRWQSLALSCWPGLCTCGGRTTPGARASKLADGCVDDEMVVLMATTMSRTTLTRRGW